MEIPRSIVLEVDDGSIPAPGLGNPTPGDTLAIGRIPVEFITPLTSGWARGGHINGETVNLATAETVASQEIARRGLGHAIFHVALGPQVDSVGMDVLGQDPRHTVRPVFTVKGALGFHDCRHAETVTAGIVAVVATDSKHDVVGVLGVEFGLFFEASEREASDGPHGIRRDVEDVDTVTYEGLVVQEGVPFFVGNEEVVFDTNARSPLVGFFHVSRAERLVEPIVLDARKTTHGPKTFGVGVAKVSSDRCGTIAVATAKGLSAKIVGLLDVLSDPSDHGGGRLGFGHELAEHLTIVVDVVDVGSSHESSATVDRKGPAVEGEKR